MRLHTEIRRGLGAVLLVSAVLAGPANAAVSVPTVAQQDDEDVPSYSLTLSPDGHALTVSGGIRFGLARDIELGLDAHPGIETIVLDSPGGRELAAELALQVIRKRGLDTYAGGDCLSACTLIFVAGKHRGLAADARLGFHSTYVAEADPPDGSTAWLLDNATIGFYMSAGVDQAFMHRVVVVPASSMWYPTKAELVAAHVLFEDGGGQDAGAAGAAQPHRRSLEAAH